MALSPVEEQEGSPLYPLHEDPGFLLQVWWQPAGWEPLLWSLNPQPWLSADSSISRGVEFSFSGKIGRAQPPAVDMGVNP